MAQVFPDGWREFAATGAAQRELQTLAQLADGLPDDYAIYHGVHWTRVEQHNFALVGEIDFAIVGPTGKVLLIEQKSGFLTETEEGLCKKYRDRIKSVPIQMARTADAIHQRLRQACPELPIALESLLYCPDYTLRQPGSAGIDPARIVDATRRDYLLPIIRGILPEHGTDGAAHPARDKIHRFFADILQLVPEVSAIVGSAHALYTRLSGGLAQWARNIECAPFRLRVVGTAGSGKTQLAMAVYRDTLAAGQRPLYVCYNRPLADHIALIAPPGGLIATYHQLADRVSRQRGAPIDFSQPDAFGRLEAILDAYTPAEAECCDTLIVDEGQDFHAGWAANLLRFLRPQGRAWWLEDPLQNLYGRAPLALPGWVTLRSDTNYRTPRDILATLNRLLPLPRPMDAGSPLSGTDVDIITYRDNSELAARSVAAITQCIGLGFKRQHIALITYRGREHSRLAPYDKLGPYPLRAPTGRYDLLGNPEYTAGDILIDSVHRFKGQAAPCVVLTEIDFETLDERAVRRLFVGATRATMKLVLVVAEPAARVLLQRLNDTGAPPMVGAQG